MIVSIYIDNQKLDLYTEEEIKVKSSVLDIQDIEKNTTDYSNSFTVPASATNNKILGHYYNADLDSDFDGRMKHPARIEMGGIPFKTGTILLQNVKMQHGKPSSYTLTFFGELASLSDIFGDTKLADLDFADFPDVEYNSNYVKGKIGALATDLISSLITKRRCYYSTDPDDTNDNNIAITTSDTNGIQWDELRMAMRLSIVIDEIETKFGLTFSDDIFHSDICKRLYLHLDSENLNETYSTTQIQDVNDSLSLYIVDGVVSINYALVETYGVVTLEITPSNDTQAYTIYTYNEDDDLIGTREIVDGGVSQTVLNYTLGSAADNTQVYFKVSSENPLSFNADIHFAYSNADGAFNNFQGNADQLATYDYSVRTAMPDITVADFVKGLISAFYCVAIKDGSNVYINNVESYFDEGDIVDLTNYADNAAVPIYRPDLLNDISYKFQDGTTLLQSKYYAKNSRYYGNEELLIYDDEGDLITGESKEIELPFEQMVYERLINAYNGVETTIGIGASVDEDGEPTVMSPHIFYPKIREVASNPISLIEDDGEKTTLSSIVNMPSHISEYDSIDPAFIFSAETDEYTGDTLTDNLYSKYHSEYIEKLFNKKTRRFEVTCYNVPLKILTTIKLNDTIKIRNDYFRINSYTVNLTTGSISLDLLR